MARQRRGSRHTVGSEPSLPVASNLLDRQLLVTESDPGWLADITVIWTLGLPGPPDLGDKKARDWIMASKLDQLDERAHGAVVDDAENGIFRCHSSIFVTRPSSSWR